MENGSIASTLVFFFLAAVMVVSSILAVTTKKILRAATYLLFVLFATAGLYFYLNYSFLGAVQMTVYAGGIIVLYVFSIFLTSTDEEKDQPIRSHRRWLGFIAAAAGTLLCVYLLQASPWGEVYYHAPEELPMKAIGNALMSADKFGYILPFEALSILLLACIIGGILIARKRR